MAALAGGSLAVGAAPVWPWPPCWWRSRHATCAVGEDTAVAVVVPGCSASEALLALRPTSRSDCEEMLFGDLLSATGGDIAAAAVLLVVGGALLCPDRPLTAVAFDAEGAAALGLRPAARALVLLGLLAAAITVRSGLGNLLVVAVLVAPAVAVRGHARTPARGDRLGAAAVAAVAGVTRHLPLLPPGDRRRVALALCPCRCRRPRSSRRAPPRRSRPPVAGVTGARRSRRPSSPGR